MTTYLNLFISNKSIFKRPIWIYFYSTSQFYTKRIRIHFHVDDLQELANLADKVSEASQPLNYQVASISTHLNIPGQTASVSATNDHFSSLVNILTKQFERLSSEIRDLRMSTRARGRSSSGNFQPRDRSRSRSSQRRCYYHQRFGKSAKKCTQPCSWKVW